MSFQSSIPHRPGLVRFMLQWSLSGHKHVILKKTSNVQAKKTSNKRSFQLNIFNFYPANSIPNYCYYNHAKCFAKNDAIKLCNKSEGVYLCDSLVMMVCVLTSWHGHTFREIVCRLVWLGDIFRQICRPACWRHDQPGASPISAISIEFEIRPKFGVF